MANTKIAWIDAMPQHIRQPMGDKHVAVAIPHAEFSVPI
jgi:hypothetical protein